MKPFILGMFFLITYSEVPPSSPGYSSPRVQVFLTSSSCKGLPHFDDVVSAETCYQPLNGFAISAICNDIISATVNFCDSSACNSSSCDYNQNATIIAGACFTTDSLVGLSIICDSTQLLANFCVSALAAFLSLLL